MPELSDLINKLTEQRVRDRHREFLFNDLVNDRCSYDPSTYEERQYDSEKDTSETFRIYYPE